MHTSLPESEVLCACTVVKKLSRCLGRRYDEQIKDTGMNITQFAMLRVVSRRAGEPLAQMAYELEMDRTSLYRAIQPMVRQGWITSGDGDEAGSRTARLTKLGNRALKDAEVRWAKVQDALVSRFGEQAYANLMRDLYRLADCMDDVELGDA